MIPTINTIARSKSDFGTSETCRDVGAGMSWPLDASDREFNLRRALCPDLASITVNSHSKPRGIKGAIFYKGNQGAAKLCAFFCKGQRESIFGKIRIERADHRMILQHQVVRDRNIRVSNITNTS